MENNKKGENMKEDSHYRSKIDELVCKSGLSGLAIAREMGITTNRIVALRRAVSKYISTDDLASCEAAILRLGGTISNETTKLGVKEIIASIDARLETIIKILGGK
jgi:predicted transcriptional regulator